MLARSEIRQHTMWFEKHVFLSIFVVQLIFVIYVMKHFSTFMFFVCKWCCPLAVSRNLLLCMQIGFGHRIWLRRKKVIAKKKCYKNDLREWTSWWWTFAWFVLHDLFLGAMGEGNVFVENIIHYFLSIWIKIECDLIAWLHGRIICLICLNCMNFGLCCEIECLHDLLDMRLDLHDLLDVTSAWMNYMTWDLICMICLMWNLHGWIIWLEICFAWFAWCENCMDELLDLKLDLHDLLDVKFA